ncbi:hypothetical protein EXQ27_04280 [Clostridium botulinum]|uniref:hypothetical protein n=1 Tax=Clostridium botulinum TaxID=1491 RepID=UPI001A93A6AE|nr:hypothetical protein [Clostridium botulinum]MBO0537931.1 hypothetical protein [Clostridium botulinum]MBO0580358.1 hypothetical protein [Clostridium botulinum]
MKREKIKYPLIKHFMPLLWKECRFCGREFKIENGFIIKDYTRVNPRLYNSYCCNDCCKTIEDVKKKIQDNEMNFKKLLKRSSPQDKKIRKDSEIYGK